MNAQINTPTTVETTVAPVAQTTTHNDDKSKNTNRYKKSVIELYQEAVEKTIDTKLSAPQVSASGLEYKGLNKAILGEAKKELDLQSNKWFSKKAMQDNNLIQISEDDYGVILFSNKLKDIEGSSKKEKIITYYRVFNEDSLELIPV